MSRFLLRPLSALYGQLLDWRNWLYDKQFKSVYATKQKTISVGNLTVGGTGKTPMVEYLLRKLLSGERPADPSGPLLATLSRGYGRKSTGFRVVERADDARTVGDEPLQLFHKFGDRVVVTVAERRAEGLQRLADQFPAIDLVLLDDAFQHRAVSPRLQILLTDYNRPFYADYPFPEGRLRERRHGARRADLIVVTKCPDGLSTSRQQEIVDRISPYKRPETPVFFTGLQYTSPRSVGDRQPAPGPRQPVVLVTGLAFADPVEAYVREQYVLHRHYRFPDHYAYRRADVEKLLRELPPAACLLTTEKDWVKLLPLLTPEERTALPIYYLPVAIRFLADEAAFLQRVRAVAGP